MQIGICIIRDLTRFLLSALDRKAFDHACQFIRLDGFGEACREAACNRLLELLLHAEARERNGRYGGQVRNLPNTLDELESIHPRHLEIGNDYIRTRESGDLNGCFCVFCNIDDISQPFQFHLQNKENVVGIFNKQYAHHAENVSNSFAGGILEPLSW